MDPKALEKLREQSAYARSCRRKGAPKRDSGAQLKRLYAMQDVMFAVSTDTHAITDDKGNVILGGISDKVSAVRAWKELELLRRLMLGKPGAIQAEQPKSKLKGSISHMPSDLDVDKAA